jgi:signal peptidase II
MKKCLKGLSIFIFFILIDIITKYYVFHYVSKMNFAYPFYPYGGIGVFHDFLGIDFSINLVENTGAAWGVFSMYPFILFFIRVLIISGLVFYLLIFNKDTRKEIPLLLIITGAMGNVLDFIFYRKVIDMFHFNFWGYSYPVFNIADSLITVGIIWLFLIFLLNKIMSKKNEN